ncbi:hypothetical protein ACHAPU_009431 [Fusarium lateritium]
MMLNIIFIAVLLLGLVTAGETPAYEGYNLVWQDTFEGAAGTLPDTQKWNIQQWYQNLNGDVQEYKLSTDNEQLSGDGSVFITPRRDPTATKGWSSGRLESTYTFTPKDGVRTIAEARIKLGDSPSANKQGIWPAFWLLGDTHRSGGPIWPGCGEIDILENVNGETQLVGSVHCDRSPGGICNETDGINNRTPLPDSGKDWHVYRIVFDRTASNWRDQTLTWFLDDVQYHQVTGARVNNEAVWGTIAQNKVFFLLNVAVGGYWPGPPNGETHEGRGAGMEVEYVAHYESPGAPSAHGPQKCRDTIPAVPQYPAPDNSAPAPVDPVPAPGGYESVPDDSIPAPDGDESTSDDVDHAPDGSIHAAGDFDSVPADLDPDDSAPADSIPADLTPVDPVPQPQVEPAPQDQQSDTSTCGPPGAGDPNHATYGVPGGWGPASGGPACPPGHNVGVRSVGPGIGKREALRQSFGRRFPGNGI